MGKISDKLIEQQQKQNEQHYKNECEESCYIYKSIKEDFTCRYEY
jgi:hypothetical protein